MEAKLWFNVMELPVICDHGSVAVRTVRYFEFVNGSIDPQF